MPTETRISPSEWKVMEVVWAGPPVTAQQISQKLGEVEEWKPQTIKTLLARLVKKGVLRAEPERNRFNYFPVLRRQAAVMAETDSFLDRISRGSLAPMLTQFVKSRRPLTKDEVTALRTLLEEHDPKTGGES